MRTNTVVLVYEPGQTADAIADQFALDGYEVRRAESPSMLRARCVPGDVRLIVIGETEHDATGLAILRAVRGGECEPQVDRDIRVLWCGTNDTVAGVLRAFAAGTDDAIRAPVVYEELLARVRVLLGRDRCKDRNVVEYGRLRIELSTREVSFGSARVGLRRMEYELLVHLAREPTRVHTKDELLQDVWGYRSCANTRTVDSHASRLRRKLALAGAEGLVMNVWGVGYCLEERRTEPHAANGSLAA